MLREWLLALIREAVRDEVAHHFRSLEDKTALIESNFASIAARAKEKTEQKTPTLGKQWGATARRLEAKSEGKV
jgi:hypothetical protein